MKKNILLLALLIPITLFANCNKNMAQINRFYNKEHLCLTMSNKLVHKVCNLHRYHHIMQHNEECLATVYASLMLAHTTYKEKRCLLVWKNNNWEHTLKIMLCKW